MSTPPNGPPLPPFHLLQQQPYTPPPQQATPPLQAEQPAQQQHQLPITSQQAPLHPTRIILLVEGTFALSSFWPDARKVYVESILRLLDQYQQLHQQRQQQQQQGQPDGQQQQKQQGKQHMPRYQLALIVFYTQDSSSPCVLDRSPWTADIGEFRQWLDALPFTGGGTLQPAVAEALAEAIYLSKCPYPDGTMPVCAHNSAAAPAAEPPPAAAAVGPGPASADSTPAIAPAATPPAAAPAALPPHTHCLMLVASPPCRLPTPWPFASETKAGRAASGLYAAPGSDSTGKAATHSWLPASSAVRVPPGTADFYDLLLAFPAHGLSLSLAAPKAAVRLYQQLFLQMHAPLTKDTAANLAIKTSHLVLLSPHFGVARDALLPIVSRMRHLMHKQMQAQAQAQAAAAARSVASNGGTPQQQQAAAAAVLARMGSNVSNSSSAVSMSGGLMAQQQQQQQQQQQTYAQPVAGMQQQQQQPQQQAYVQPIAGMQQQQQQPQQQWQQAGTVSAPGAYGSVPLPMQQPQQQMAQPQQMVQPQQQMLQPHQQMPFMGGGMAGAAPVIGSMQQYQQQLQPQQQQQYQPQSMQALLMQQSLPPMQQGLATAPQPFLQPTLQQGTLPQLPQQQGMGLPAVQQQQGQRQLPQQQQQQQQQPQQRHILWTGLLVLSLPGQQSTPFADVEVWSGKESSSLDRSAWKADTVALMLTQQISKHEIQERIKQGQAKGSRTISRVHYTVTQPHQAFDTMRARCLKDNTDVMLQTALAADCLAVFHFGGVDETRTRNFMEGYGILTAAA